MDKHILVKLFRPDGLVIEVGNVDVVKSWNKDNIEFQLRVEKKDTVTITEYTSNLPYVIIETVTGPKDLI